MNGEDYVQVLNSNYKNLTFTKVNKLIGTPADFPKNFQTSLRGKWDVVPVLGPDLQTEKEIKLKTTLQNFPITYLSKYKKK